MVVHDASRARGSGYKLVDTVIGIGHEKGLEEIYGFVLSENTKMLNMCRDWAASWSRWRKALRK